MGILAVRRVPEKVESWREWGKRGECVTLDRSVLFMPCQVWGLPRDLAVHLVDLFYRVNGNRSG